MVNQPTNGSNKYNFYQTSTKSERLMALALMKKGIQFQANPLIRLSACIKYTPDFLIGGKLIVEVDGSIHDQDYRKSPDRIRQRALGKIGYSVYRVRNEIIINSPQKVADEILGQYSKIFDAKNTQSKSLLSRIGNIRNMTTPEANYDRTLSVATRLNGYSDKWNYERFRAYLSNVDPDFLKYPCHTERLLLRLMGLELTTDNDGCVNFKSYFDFFMSGLDIMSKLYGDLGRTYLINSFSVSVANFMKNLIFHGGPWVKPGLVIINSIKSLENHISKFNSYFSSIGITLEIDDLKSECKPRVERLDSISREKYLWLSDWISQSTAKE